jgi:hypothetical protein
MRLEAMRLEQDLKPFGYADERGCSVDESASPRALDWVDLNTSDGIEVPDHEAIHGLEGDRFTLRSGGFNDARPRDFEAGDGIWANVFVFQRSANP